MRAPEKARAHLTYGNKLNDIDHLVGHKINGRDIFVTDDGSIHRKSEELQKAPGIVVMTPKQCLNFLTELVAREKKVSLHSARAVEGYVSKELRWRVGYSKSLRG